MSSVKKPAQPQKKKDRISRLEDKVDKLVDIIEAVVEQKPEKKEEKKPEPKIKDADGSAQDQHIPRDYINLVKEMLGEDFGLKIDYFTDRPEFMLSIIVPKKFSSLDGNNYDERGGDVRSRVIKNAEGINGVREWVKMVHDNVTRYMNEQIK